jgi:thiosulfate dehydrogenase [quinone] large subunit
MIVTKSCVHLEDGDLALGCFVLRLCLGVNIFMHGVSRLAAGPAIFVAQLLKQFHDSVLPVWSLCAFGYALPWIETLIGVFIILGLKTRVTLLAGGLLVAVLTFGSALTQQWEITGTQLIYGIAFALLLCLARYDSFSADSLLGRLRAAIAPKS